jgi:hypothetical protein
VPLGKDCGVQSHKFDAMVRTLLQEVDHLTKVSMRFGLLWYQILRTCLNSIL